MGTAVVATGYGSESFLSSSIPLQANKMKRKHKRILVLKEYHEAGTK